MKYFARGQTHLPINILSKAALSCPLLSPPSLLIIFFFRGVLKILILAERHSDFRPQVQTSLAGFIHQSQPTFLPSHLTLCVRGRFNYAMKCSTMEAEYQ